MTIYINKPLTLLKPQGANIDKKVGEYSGPIEIKNTYILEIEKSLIKFPTSCGPRETIWIVTAISHLICCGFVWALFWHVGLLLATHYDRAAGTGRPLGGRAGGIHSSFSCNTRRSCHAGGCGTRNARCLVR